MPVLPGRFQPHDWRQRLRSHLDRWRPVGFVVALGLLVGLFVGTATARYEPDDQIIVGNTSGTLSALLVVDGHTIVIGGGDSRSGLADLVGRSTLPWQRHIDLLIVPAADDAHLAGALGLVERGAVSGLVLLGFSEDSAALAMLEREADRAKVSVRYVDNPHYLTLDDGVEVRLQADQPASVEIRYHQARIVLIDSTSTQVTGNSTDPVPNAHVVISMRQGRQGLPGASLLVQPYAERSRALQASDAIYRLELERGERCTLRLHAESIRTPLSCLEKNPAESMDVESRQNTKLL